MSSNHLLQSYKRALVLILGTTHPGLVSLIASLKIKGLHHLIHLEELPIDIESINEIRPDIVIIADAETKEQHIDTIKLIRSTSLWQHIPVLAPLSPNQPEWRSRLFEAGASDFLLLPFDLMEITRKASLCLEVNSLKKQFDDFTTRISLDLDTATSLQNDLLPSRPDLAQLEKDYKIKLCHLFKPCTELAGDLWGIFPIDEHRYSIFLADITGHGICSALHAFRLHALLHHADIPVAHPNLMMGFLNQKLCSLFPVNIFSTFLYIVFDLKEENCSITSAGAPWPIIFRDHQTPQIIEMSGLPLGIHPDAEYESKTIPFAKGDRILLYSDALIESPNRQGANLSEAQIASALSECYGSVQNQFNLLISLFLDHIELETAKDDLTIIMAQTLE
jgi:sigma-B regulation protein RsbU (phosphoserine phosphatase)